MLKPSQVRRIRKELGLTRAELARLLKADRVTVWRWEMGKANVSPANAHLLEIMLERHRQAPAAPAPAGSAEETA